ncbi:hypothetical protein BDF21DRAFT_463851 [Thamnidium elegans]|nr:hypothetical protein BDF21DRAFT_463851 [Thamnidium elegans]
MVNTGAKRVKSNITQRDTDDINYIDNDIDDNNAVDDISAVSDINPIDDFNAIDGDIDDIDFNGFNATDGDVDDVNSADNDIDDTYYIEFMDDNYDGITVSNPYECITLSTSTSNIKTFVVPDPNISPITINKKNEDIYNIFLKNNIGPTATDQIVAWYNNQKAKSKLFASIVK